MAFKKGFSKYFKYAFLLSEPPSSTIFDAKIAMLSHGLLTTWANLNRLQRDDQAARISSIVSSSWKRALRRLQTAYLTTATFNSEVALGLVGRVAGLAGRQGPRNRAILRTELRRVWCFGDFHQDLLWVSWGNSQSWGNSHFARH